MLTVMKKGANIHCKPVTDNFFTVIDLLVVPCIAIKKPKGYIEAYISIR